MRRQEPNPNAPPGPQLLRKVKRRLVPYIPNSLLEHLQTPYRPMKHGRLANGKKETILDLLLAPYRRRLDRGRFRRSLRPTDVFLVGHPKSGNTWIAYMLAIILNKDSQHKITLANIGTYVPVIHGQDSAIANHADLVISRVFRNESPIYPELYPKTIYLVRDPRAALVSLYEMYKTYFDDRSLSLNAFLDEYLAYGCIRKWEPLLERWDRQVLAWMKRAQHDKHDKHVMVVKYEDVTQDRRNVLERIVRFIGIPCQEETLALAVDRGSFEAMRKNEEEHGAESYPGEIGQRGRFIRRGKTDGWKSELSQSMIHNIENEFGSVMKALGYL